ncbi:MAG: hypothetical protein ACKO4Y_06695 [Flavobacteriales bacterium]
MILSGFGVVLRRINADDIEQIRRWRNQDFIRNQMFHQDIISETQQVTWFDSVNNPTNYYFIIQVDDLPIGLIFAKNVNPITNVGEGGIFIGDPAFLISDAPARASILLLYFCFNTLGLTNSFIRIKVGNDAALKYNELLGYVVQETSASEWLLCLTKKAFFEAFMVSRLLSRLDPTLIILSGLPSVNNLDHINELLASNRQ